MAWVLVAGTFCAVTLLLVMTWIGEKKVGLPDIYNFAPESGAVLVDSRTDDGSYIVPLGRRPYYSDRCSKRVRGQVVTGFCW